MAEIKKYVCDVKDCNDQLAPNYGSHAHIEIKNPPNWTAPGYTSIDLCGKHLDELMAWCDVRGIKIDVDC